MLVKSHYNQLIYIYIYICLCGCEDVHVSLLEVAYKLLLLFFWFVVYLKITRVKRAPQYRFDYVFHFPTCIDIHICIYIYSRY